MASGRAGQHRQRAHNPNKEGATPSAATTPRPYIVYSSDPATLDHLPTFTITAEWPPRPK